VHNVPVVYEADPVYSARLKEFVSELKAKPRVVWVDSIGKDLRTASKYLEDCLKRERIVPTKITALGAIRDLCVIKGLRQLRMIFPKVEINVLEGTSTLQPTWSSKSKRLELNAEMKGLGIKRSKKLNIKHLI